MSVYSDAKIEGRSVSAYDDWLDNHPPVRRSVFDSKPKKKKEGEQRYDRVSNATARNTGNR